MPAGGAIVAGAAGLAKTITGLIGGGKAKREAARLAASRPKLTESPYVKDQLRLAQSELSRGMSSEADNAYNQLTDRDLSSSIGAILKGGGSVNNIADVFDNSQQGRQRYALMRENLRLNQINNLERANAAADNERAQLFQYNEYSPWANAAAANAQARASANQQLWSGIDTIGSAAISFAGMKNSQKLAELNNNPVQQISNTAPALNYSPVIASTIPLTRSVPSPAARYPQIPTQLPMYGFEPMADYSRVGDYVPQYQVQ